MSQYRIWHGCRENGELYYVGQRMNRDGFYEDITEKYSDIDDVKWVMQTDYNCVPCDEKLKGI